MTNTLTTTEAGQAVRIINIKSGEYAWHQGAYRRIEAVNASSIKFAGVRKHLHFTSSLHTLEVAP